jgi:hypothetical protein
LFAFNVWVLVYGASLAGALLIGAVVIALVGRWRRRTARETDALNASEQLAHFRTLYERGTISQEEYNRLRALLGSQLREALDVPPPAPAAVKPEQVQLPPPAAPGPPLAEENKPAEGGDTGIRPA